MAHCRQGSRKDVSRTAIHLPQLQRTTTFDVGSGEGHHQYSGREDRMVRGWFELCERLLLGRWRVDAATGGYWTKRALRGRAKYAYFQEADHMYI